MKKIKKIIIIINIFALIVIAYLLMLYPKHKYLDETIKNEKVATNEIISNVMKQNVSFKNSTVIVDLTEEDIKGLILNYDKENNIEKLDVVIKNDHIKIYAVTKYLDIVPIEITSDIEVKKEDYEVKLVVNSSKAGVISIDCTEILDNLKTEKIPFTDIRPIGNEIVLKDSQLANTIEITDGKANKGKLTLNIGFKIDGMDDFVKIIGMLSK